MDSKNPYEKYLALFEKWPSVFAETVQGEHGMRVGGWHQTPDGAKTASSRLSWAMFGWGVSLAYLVLGAHPYLRHNEYFGMKTCSALAFIVWVVLCFFTDFVLDQRSLKKTEVGISPSFIQLGEKVYDARVQHKFTMDVHRKAKEEADEELRVQQRGPGSADTRHPRYYRDGYHIFLEYLGQRILVTDAYKEDTAEKLLRALMAVDKIVHKEKTVFATNGNANTSGMDESPEARVERLDYFGTRPALD
jgi:hypothetical protein